MNKASHCMSRSLLMRKFWSSHNTANQVNLSQPLCALFNSRYISEGRNLKTGNFMCKGKQLWCLLNERLNMIKRDRNFLHHQYTLSQRQLPCLYSKSQLKRDFSSTSCRWGKQRRSRKVFIYKGNGGSLENVSWHTEEDKGLEQVLSQLQNNETSDRLHGRVSSPYTAENVTNNDNMSSHKQDLLNYEQNQNLSDVREESRRQEVDGNMDELDGMESQIIQRIEKLADDFEHFSVDHKNVSHENLYQSKNELIDLTRLGTSAQERIHSENIGVVSSPRDGILRDEKIEDFTREESFSRDEIEDFYEEEVEEEEIPQWTSPVELTRGKMGVFDLDEVVTVLESENAQDLFVLRLPPEVRLSEYMIIASGKSTRHITAMIETVRLIYKKKKLKSDPWMKTEGEKGDDWIAADLGNIILHVMMPETREHYDLETLWTVGAEYDDKCRESDDNFLLDLDWLRELNESQIKK